MGFAYVFYMRKKKHEKKIKHIHDISWKKILVIKRAFEELTKYFVPELSSVVRFFNFKKARCLNTEFSGSTLKRISNDVLWQIPVRGKGDLYL